MTYALQVLGQQHPLWRVWLVYGAMSTLTIGLIGADSQGLFAAVRPSVYYQVTVLPGWLQPFATLNPATHALDAIRATWIGGVGLAVVWPAMIRLLGTGTLLVLIGVMIFQAGERYALRTGK
ncbi:MAG: type transporter [Symbiobacteriaceae bacterium]|nr:type transporter [Symbiobacteriaceae bacterium]